MTTRARARTAKDRDPVGAYLEAVRRSKGSHAYAALLGIDKSDAASLTAEVEKGLPFGKLVNLTRVMGMTLQAAAEILFISPRSLQRRKVEGRLHADESDRLLRLSRMFGLAIELFEGDKDAAITWMNRSLPVLADASPLEMSKTEPGALEVERLIGRLEHGVFS
jgi:putative toxin-antitoxin system antitoxin component (TIGR02293 family)